MTLAAILAALGVLLILVFVFTVRRSMTYPVSAYALAVGSAALLTAAVIVVFDGVPDAAAWLSPAGIAMANGALILAHRYVDGVHRQSFARASRRRLSGTPGVEVPPQSRTLPRRSMGEAPADRWNALLCPAGQAADRAASKAGAPIIRAFLFECACWVAYVLLIGPTVLGKAWGAPLQFVAGVVSLLAIGYMLLAGRVVFGVIIGQADDVSVYQAFSAMRPWIGPVPGYDRARWRYRQGNIEWIAFDAPLRGLHTVVLTGPPVASAEDVPEITKEQFDRVVKFGAYV